MRTTEPCRNCGNTRPGHYCANCGRRNGEVRVSLRGMLARTTFKWAVLSLAYTFIVGATLLATAVVAILLL